MPVADDGGRRAIVTGPTRLVTDADGRILEAAGRAGGLLGIEDRRLVGRPLAAFIPEGRRQDFRTLLLDLSHSVGSTGLSLDLRGHNGRQVTVEVEARAEAGGQRLEWLFAQSEIEEPPEPPPARPLPDRAPLGRLLMRLPVGIVSINSDLDVDYVNPSALVYLGSGGVGRPLPDPWPGFSLRTFGSRLFTSSPPPRAAVETGSGRMLELDGIPAGPDTSALLILQDVTSRERQRRAEREFVANAAHELRTPIAAIAGALEVLQRGAKEKPADRDLFLAHIERESDRLGRLAGSLLLLTRIQTGQETPALQAVAVGPLLEEIAAQLEPSERVAVSISCGAGVGMLADYDLLRQAVWNLAANAVRHTHEGQITLSGRELGQFSEIEIRDTGVGIPEPELERIFDRFFRGARRSGSGFGLGLPIAREVVRALGGSVDLDSQVGVGTRVRVALPSARQVEI